MRISFTLLSLVLSFKTWSQTSAQLMSMPEGDRITALSFLNRNVGFACGYGGRILKTTDGGESWFSLNSGTNVQLNGIVTFSPFDMPRVAAVAENGDLLFSTDQGATWTAINVSTSPLNHAFTRRGRLFVVNRQGELIIEPHLETGNFTINVAGSWANLDRLDWINDTTGFLIADSTHAFTGKSVLFRTTNSGFSWERVQKIQSFEGWPNDTLMRNYCFRNLHQVISTGNDSSLMMIGGYYPGYIWRSQDGGKSFYLHNQIIQVNPQQIQRIDSSRYALISWQGDALQPYIHRNRNGAQTWHQMLSDTGNFRLPAPFKPAGKATFFGNEVFIPGYLQNTNGSNTGAIMRVQQIFPELLTAQKPIVAESEMRLFPVPAREEIWLEANGNQTPLQLWNAQGQELPVLAEELEGRVRIRLSGLAPGLYRLGYGNQTRSFLIGK